MPEDGGWPWCYRSPQWTGHCRPDWRWPHLHLLHPRPHGEEEQSGAGSQEQDNPVGISPTGWSWQYPLEWSQAGASDRTFAPERIGWSLQLCLCVWCSAQPCEWCLQCNPRRTLSHCREREDACFCPLFFHWPLFLVKCRWLKIDYSFETLAEFKRLTQIEVSVQLFLKSSDLAMYTLFINILVNQLTKNTLYPVLQRNGWTQYIIFNNNCTI